MFLIRNQVIMFIVKLAHKKLQSFIHNMGLFWWLSCNQEMQVLSLDLEDPIGEENGNVSRKFHGQRSLAGYSPWGLKRVWI